MINPQAIRLKSFLYNTIFIVEDRNHWETCSLKCDKEHDLILCVDFALKNELELNGFNVAFLDHLVESSVLDDLNAKMWHFLYNWNRDEFGNDILAHEGFDLGEALLLNLINDVTYFCLFFFNIYAIKSINYKKLIVATNDEVVLNVLNKLGLEYVFNHSTSKSNRIVYSFPIAKWMHEAINKINWKEKLKIILGVSLDRLGIIFDNVIRKEKKRIFIQAYHPTFKIIDHLITSNITKIVLPDYVKTEERKNIFKQRRIQYKDKQAKGHEKEFVLAKYNSAEKYKWEFEGHVISDHLYEIIKKTIELKIDGTISKAKSIKKYFDKHPLHLMIPVTNFWLENRLIMNYCRNNKIPVFFIVNGLLNNSYLNEGMDSDFVNCYSQSCKEDFFKCAANVFALGDPRMDKYANTQPKTINRLNPIIMIGAAGYDVTNINSYLAYEFDFLYDILKSTQILINEGFQAKIVLKVRANGYAHLYDSFVKEYFPNIEIKVIQYQNFYEVVKEADLYISIFSQTIFEASCLGIPAIYYKKDTEKIFRPFDGKSELITAENIEELIQKIKMFYSDSSEFSMFKDKAVLEKYIGPLDGNNLKRNIDFIGNLLNNPIDRHSVTI